MKGDLVIFIHPSSNLLGDEPELLGVVCVVIVFFCLFFLIDAAKMEAKQICVKFLPTYTHRQRPTLTDSPACSTELLVGSLLDRKH